MVIVNPLSRIIHIIPVPNGLNGSWMGVTIYLLTGMILQVGAIFQMKQKRHEVESSSC